MKIQISISFLIVLLIVSCTFSNESKYAIAECLSLQLNLESLVLENDSLILEFSMKNIASQEIKLDTMLLFYLSSTSDSCSHFQFADQVKVINDSISIRTNATLHYVAKIIEKPNEFHNLDCSYKLFSYLNGDNEVIKCFIISEPKRIGSR